MYTAERAWACCQRTHTRRSGTHVHAVENPPTIDLAHPPSGPEPHLVALRDQQGDGPEALAGLDGRAQIFAEDAIEERRPRHVARGHGGPEVECNPPQRAIGRDTVQRAADVRRARADVFFFPDIAAVCSPGKVPQGTGRGQVEQERVCEERISVTNAANSGAREDVLTRRRHAELLRPNQAQRGQGLPEASYRREDLRSQKHGLCSARRELCYVVQVLRES